MPATPSLPTGAPSAAESARLLAGVHPDPHAILGCHTYGDGIVIRALYPGADEVGAVFSGGDRVDLTRVHQGGLFSTVLPGPVRPYRFVVRTGHEKRSVADGYLRLPTVGPPGVRLLASGRHHRLWTMLGAHRVDGGVAFMVWAPRARGVRLCGDLNDWCGAAHPLRRLDGGVWGVWVPDVPDGTRYRFEVLGADGRWREKVDPMAAATERPPAVASVVFGSNHRWTDGDWLARRADTDWAREPISVYQVHLGSWAAGSPGYRQIADELVEYTRALGFTHVQLLPLAEYPFGGSWGYQVGSYFAPTARHGDPDDLRYLVDRLHANGIGVFFDVVPAHFAPDEWALACFDGAPLYEYADPRLGEQPEWGTRVFDFDRPEVRGFLVSAALHWIDEFHADGVRIDAVSAMLYRDFGRADGTWLPNAHGGRENLAAAALLRALTDEVHARYPGVLVIAEETTGWPGVTARDGLGFDLKWNVGWATDTLGHLRRDPMTRAGAGHLLTRPLRYAWQERFVLTLSHDNATDGGGWLWDRMPGDDRQRAAGVRALLAHMWAHPGKQLLFMGGEFGQPGEWDANVPLPWHLVDDERGSPLHRGIQCLVADLNTIYRALPALYTMDHDPAGFTALPSTDADVLAFLRTGADGTRLVCVENFTDKARPAARIGLPAPGPWWVVLDTDLADYGGSRTERRSRRTAEPLPVGDQPRSLEIDMAALSVLWLTDSSCSTRDYGNLPK
jgi:1,4-alpha-glucan branching enzyme